MSFMSLCVTYFLTFRLLLIQTIVDAVPVSFEIVIVDSMELQNISTIFRMTLRLGEK